MLLLCFGIVVWSFLEASFWWVAPDISISIAYVHFPKHWRRFVLLALCGAFLGSLTTYLWANLAQDAWLQYVTGMRFHSQANINYVNTSIQQSSYAFSVIKGAWGGIPYKLFIGFAAIYGIAFTKIASFGLISRGIRFLFVLAVTVLIRYFSRPWSNKHPTQLSVILLCIWATMIAVFDVLVNRVFV